MNKCLVIVVAGLLLLAPSFLSAESQTREGEEACPTQMIDTTSPEFQELLETATLIRLDEDLSFNRSEGWKISSADFIAVRADGSETEFGVSCVATCNSDSGPCAIVGCDISGASCSPFMCDGSGCTGGSCTKSTGPGHK